MSGKSKPELGLFVLDEPKATGKGIVGSFVLEDGLVATASFDSAWPLAEGGYYDIEAKSKDSGDSAFIQVAKLPSKGAALEKLPKKFFTEAILGVDGRYGSYGAPIDIKVLSDEPTTSGSRRLEIAFTALSPGGAEAPRRGFISALQPAGTKSEVVLLTASTGLGRWKKGGKEESSRAAETFAVTTTPTALKQVPSSDYRYGKTSGPSNMSSRNDGF